MPPDWRRWSSIRPSRIYFHSLRSRLAVLYTGMFALAFGLLGITAQALIWTHTRTSVAAELAASGSVYDGLWALRAKTLNDSAAVLARDFGFRTAVASGDAPTIESALVTLRGRAGVAHAMVVDQDGRVIGATGVLARAIAGFVAAEPDRRDAVLVPGRMPYRVVVSPILAPMPIGSVVFALPLDAREMHALERLSAIPLTATMLRRQIGGHGRSHWVATDGSVVADPAVDALVAASRHARPLTTLALPGGLAFAIARPLSGPNGSDQAALLIRYPLLAALKPYLPLQLGLTLTGLIGIALAGLGSVRLAASIARPIAALDAAARALERGDHTALAVVGQDEIGRLAASFNKMSAGIVERERQIAHLAFHDPLTGLPNRAYFRQTLDQALIRALPRHRRVALLCLDLDRLTAVNDTLGHAVGDAVLRAVGMLVAACATDCLVARLRGDDFAILLPDDFAPDRPRQLAQAILDAVATPSAIAGHRIAPALSIGIAMSPDDGTDPDQLVKSAELALARAKHDGRGVFRFFEAQLDATARARRQLELDLRDALSSGQFRLAFQPIYDLAADRIGGFEALLRWTHPTRGEVGPAEFIPVAEDSGMIVAIGEWAMHEACRQAAAWPDHVRVAVNVSPLQFHRPGLEAIILQALARSGLSPQRLEVEITESVFVEGDAQVLALLHGLRSMGLRFALDDFGTGYSSLGYLRRFPFDKIKIDRSFVARVAQDAGTAAIVRAIIDLATALGMETTAEGVEDAEQWAHLHGQGCTSIQGYYFSRPVDGATAEAMLLDRSARAA